MNIKLSSLESAALLSAKESGQIDVPCGSAVEIDNFLHSLVRLQKIGLLSRVTGKAFYRPFILTSLGEFHKTRIIGLMADLENH